MSSGITRRSILASSALALGAGAVPPALAGAAGPAGPAGEKKAPTFRFCLNASTIMGQKLPLPQQVEVVAKAGYDAFEPWVRDIDAYAKSGGSLPDLKKRIADSGLSIEDAIGFSQWIVDDEAARQKGMDQFKREMELASQIGCRRMAAPPGGATNQVGFDLLKAAERYRALAEMGQPFGITPQLEIWGHSKVLSRLGEAALVAAESGLPNACILPDVFHMYKGNTPFTGLRVLSATAIQMIHLNDYPADPPREKANDSMRVYPGEGVAPWSTIIQALAAINPQCILSLELFNREYWKLDALECAKRGLEKMKAVVAKAMQ